MSEIKFCIRGGMPGISFPNLELLKFSNAIDSDPIDSVIPLPKMKMKKQIALLQTCITHDDVSYWEVEDTGSHGFCCSACGKVIQWG